MIAFVLNCLMALLWAGLSHSLWSLSTGFCIGFLILTFADHYFEFLNIASYIKKGINFLCFIYSFGFTFLESTFQMFWAILTVSPQKLTPQLSLLSVEKLTETEIAILSTFINITPGTLILESKNGFLLVHSFNTSQEKAKIELENDLKYLLLRVTR